jgi:hypothetical protein
VLIVVVAGDERVGDAAVEVGHGVTGSLPLADGGVVDDVAEVEDVADVEGVDVVGDPRGLGGEDAGVVEGVVLGVGEDDEVGRLAGERGRVVGVGVGSTRSSSSSGAAGGAAGGSSRSSSLASSGWWGRRSSSQADERAAIRDRQARRSMHRR